MSKTARVLRVETTDFKIAGKDVVTVTALPDGSEKPFETRVPQRDPPIAPGQSVGIIEVGGGWELMAP